MPKKAPKTSRRPGLTSRGSTVTPAILGQFLKPGGVSRGPDCVTFADTAVNRHAA